MSVVSGRRQSSPANCQVHCVLTLHSIEDNLVITKTGSENLTTVVRDPDEIEKIVSSS